MVHDNGDGSVKVGSLMVGGGSIGFDFKVI